MTCKIVNSTQNVEVITPQIMLACRVASPKLAVRNAKFKLITTLTSWTHLISLRRPIFYKSSIFGEWRWTVTHYMVDSTIKYRYRV